MRISLRTGSGRGVYELAGSQGDCRAADLFNKELFYELTPGLVVPGRARADLRQGEPRIKLDNQKNTTHLYRLLAGLLLLPKPKREFKITGGNILVDFEKYSITIIKIDVCSVQLEKAIVRPTDIVIANNDGLEKRIRFVDRVSRILALWKAAEDADGALAELLRNHRASLYSAIVDFKAVERTAMHIFGYFKTTYDPLEHIEKSFGLTNEVAQVDFPSVIGDDTFGLDDDTAPEIARIDNIRQWRQVAVRGSSALKFRADVRNSYNETCLLSGQRLPKLSAIASAGVDAAHILPWSSFDLNCVSNGLCLSKICERAWRPIGACCAC